MPTKKQWAAARRELLKRREPRPARMGLTSPTPLTGEQIDAIAAAIEATAAVAKYSGLEASMQLIHDGLLLEFGEMQTGEILRRTKAAAGMLKSDEIDTASLKVVEPQIATMSAGRRRNTNASNGAANRRLTPSQVSVAAKAVR